MHQDLKEERHCQYCFGACDEQSILSVYELNRVSKHGGQIAMCLHTLYSNTNPMNMFIRCMNLGHAAAQT